MENLLKTHWHMQSEKQLSHYAFGDNGCMSHYLLSYGQLHTYSMDFSVLGFVENY